MEPGKLDLSPSKKIQPKIRASSSKKLDQMYPAAVSKMRESPLGLDISFNNI
jgi:hypothetical protein